MYEAAVIDMKGDVSVDTECNGQWFTPWIGMKLKRNAKIRTGENSYLDIVFDAEGLNVLRIKENTSTTVKLASVELKEGAVFAKFDNLTPGNSFKVRTPTATCGIRGSGMGVEYINNMTVVSAFEHSVYVQGVDSNGNPVGQEVIIPEDWKTQVLGNGNVNPPAELTDNEREIFEAWVDFIINPAPGPEDDDIEDELGDEVDTKNLEEKKEISPSE
jgi:hypothetical protein